MRGFQPFGVGKRVRLAIWALASLALTAVPEARAAEPDSANLLQEIKALREVVRDLLQTVQSLERRVIVLEGRVPATTPVSPAKPSGAQAASPAAPPAATASTVTPTMPQAAMPVPQAAPAAPAETASPAPAATPQGAPPAAPQAPAAVPRAARIGAATEYASPEAMLRANWSKIKADMDESEVAGLLGPPSKKLTLDGRAVWYYYYPATGSGSVFFTAAGRVTSRQSPFGWWDW